MKYINLYDGKENEVSNSIYEKVRNLNKTVMPGGWIPALDGGLVALPYHMSEESKDEIVSQWPLPFPRFKVTDQIVSWDQTPYGTMDLLKTVSEDPNATKILTNYGDTYGLNGFLIYSKSGVAHNDFILSPSTPPHLVAGKYRLPPHLLDMTIRNTGEHFLAFVIKTGAGAYALMRIKAPVESIVRYPMALTIMYCTTTAYGNDFSVGALLNPENILETATMLNQVFEENPKDTLTRNMGSAHIDGIIMDAVDEDD